MGSMGPVPSPPTPPVTRAPPPNGQQPVARRNWHRSPTSSPPGLHDLTPLPDRPPPRPPRAVGGRAAGGRAGGPGVADRHGGGDRRALRRQPRHVRDRRRRALADR